MHQDPIQTCPYDPVHRIMRSRMPFHLGRCRQNFPCSKKKQCPFDARHLINPIEFNYHISNCPSRENVWHYRLQNEEELRHQCVLPIEVESVIATDENWDAEPEVRSYDPERSIQNRAVVRSTVGLSKSKRRQFKMDERRRIQALDANNQLQQKIAAQVPKSDDNENEPYKPLRRPKKLLSDTLNSSALSLNSSIVSVAGEKSTQQKKSMPESQAKANTSAELDVINEHQEKMSGQAQKTNDNGNEYKQLRRPKTLPTDTLNMSALSLNSSITSIASEKSTLQKKPTLENASAFWTSSKSVQKPNTPAPNGVPFSYAAALSRNITNTSDNFDVIEEERYDNEKENTANNSFFSRKVNDSIIDKISKTVEGLDMDDAAHKKKSELLNKEIEKLKEKETLKEIEKLKTLKKNSDSNVNKKFFKCGANFPVLK